MQRKFYSISFSGFRSLFSLLVLISISLHMQAQTTTIEKTTVSGCYYYSGASKTTISVQVGWTGANSNDVIVVQLDGSLSRTINVEDMYDPGTGSAIAGPIRTPQVVAFEINADGLSHTITAQMSGTHFSTATPVNITAPNPCIPMQCNGTDLGGTIYNDNNADGQKQSGETVGIPSITVRAFDVNGNVYVATSDLNGAYAFSAANGNAIPTNAYPVRVEFTNFPNWAFSNSGPSNSTNSSSVQFVSAPSCSVNCGAVNPINYSQSNPKVISNIYTNNNPLAGGSAGNNAALISHDYNNNQDYNYNNLANASAVGSVWAKAWNKFKKKMFVSAFLKRHCGFGPLGIGGIYQVDMVNPNSPVVSNFIDVTTLNINLGQASFPANNAGRGMGGNKLSPNADAPAFAGVGKYGIGGMDLSDDGNILYFVNLFDKKVYSIDLTNYYATGNLPTASNVSSITISDPGCSNGSFRPFALKIREGKMYIGMVCDASSGTTSKLVAYVKSFDLTSQTWSDVFDFPLTYPKGYPDEADGTRTGWYVWSDDPAVVNPSNNQAVMHPVPILSDIEFDMDGTMVLALMDRTSHQYGIQNTDFWNGSSWQLSSVWLVAAGGDVLRAYYSNGAYVLENAAKAGPAVGYSSNNNQGPGFGEFYNDDINGGVYYHTEMGTGGLTLRPGSGEVMAGMVDPSYYQGGPLWANGVRRMSNSNGQSTGAMAYYSDSGISLFGKANGMGDMELVSDNVVYLELGNYAWNDMNNNGVQDPNESGVNGVVLKIYNAATGALVGTTTTSGNGNYYFSTLSGTSLLPNTSYNILIGEGQYNAGNQSLNIGGTLYNLSPVNNGQGPDPDLNDNDFSASVLSNALGAQPAGLPMFTITTGNAGYINHTIDLGIRACVVDAGNNLNLSCNNPSGQIGTPGIPGYAYSWLPTAGLSDPSIAQPIASPSVTTTYTLTVNGLCTDQVTVNVNGVFPSADAGIDKTLDCTTTSTSIGTTAIVGNTYSWSPSTGLNATNIAEPTASPTSTTTYTVTVTGSNGCTATDVVTVNVNTTPPTVDAGLDKNLDCTTTSTSIGTTAIVGNTYSWSPSTGLNATNIAEPTASPTSTTSYTVTVTGSNGCTATDVVTVNVNTTPPTVDAGMDKDLDCTTTSTSIGTTAIVGNTYSWSPSTGLNATNIAEPTASPTSTTSYTVTVTGSNGCTATDVVTVNVNTTPPTVDAGMDKDLDCTTTSTSIGTTAIVGNTYSWSPSTGLNATNIAEPTASPTSTTSYTVTVTGSNGCTATDVVTVNVNTTPPTVDAGMDKDLDCTTTSTSIGTTAVVGNTYSWSPSTGLNATNIAEPTASPTSTTSYTVTVTGSNGCTATDVVTVNVNTTPPTVDAGMDKDLDCTTTSTSIGTTAIVGNTYSWSPSTGLNATNIAEPTASPTSTTSYTVTVTGSNGCTATDVVTVNVNTTPPTVDAGMDKNLDCTTTSTSIGTTAIVGNTYSWSPSTGLNATNIAEPTASPTSTTSYTVTVTGSNGCTATDVVTVNVNTTPPTVDAGMDKNLDCTTTSTSIGTTAIVGNTYSWSPSTGLNATNIAEPTASPTSTTSYTVTVTGSNGCTATDVVTVNVNTTPPTVDAGMDKDLDCTTTSTSIGTTAIVGNTYSWSPSTGLNATNIAEPTASPTSTTSYTVTVTGSNGCTATDVVTVNVNTTPPTVDAGMDKDLDCTTTSTSIGTTAIVGNTYSWSPSTGLNATNIAEPTASPTSTTSYTVTVTGSNGCTATDVVTVNVNTTPPTVDAGMDKDLDCTTTSTSIGTTAIVGNTYSWSPSTGLNATNIAEPTASPTSTTSYTVTVTGSNGCTATDVVTVNVNTTPPTVDAGMDKDLDCTTTSTSIGTTAIVGNTYSWSPSTGLNATNIAEPTASPTSTTSYTVTVTGSNGCTATDVVDVNVNTTPPTPLITGNLIVCNNATTTLDASGGVSYVWMPGGSVNSSIVVGPGSYTVTATASNGCTATSVATVESVEGSVGNYVWYDSNGNGVFDENSSAGINNITVELWKESSPGSGIYALDQSTSTANNGLGDPGYYEFVICESANYKVRFPLSSGGFPLTSQTATAGTDGNSDADRVSGESAVFAIDVNGTGLAKDNPTIDAGYYKPAQLGNYVWHDVDRDGIQDGNEVGVAGVTVTLYNSTNNAVVGATVTDAYGYYRFAPLSPGTYYVGFSTPANYVLTGSDQGSDDALDSDANPSDGLSGNYTLVAGDSNMTVDAGIYVPSPQIACLGDRVWLDLNQNGIQDALEVGVAGVTVTLLNGSGQSIATTITNANGIYSFCNLVPGTYSVVFSRPIGYVLTSNDQGGNDEQDSDADVLTGQTSTVTLLAGDNNLSLDAGLYAQLPTNAGLGNYVWNDVNNNGVQDINETGVAGVTVTLYAADGSTVLNTTTTDELGYYIFNNLIPATYVVGFSNLPSGFVFTTTDQGGNDASDSDPDTGTGLTAQIELSSGEFDMSIDAGIYNPGLPIGALGNYVWYDWNKNGVQDATENGVPGVSVTLYASDGTTVLNTTVTNLSGNYLFDNLAAGTYIVGFSNIPAGYAFTPSDQGGDDATDSDPDLITYKTAATVLGVGEVNLTLDAGIIENAGRNNLGSLGDRVWYDDNQNGMQDVGENGVVGVTVSLYQADGITLINSKTTDALGNYIFTGLPAGSYVVGFSNIPGGYTFTTANQGSDDELDADADAVSSGKTGIVNLALGEENLSLDAGIYAAPGLASLGNYVWNDVNQDGIQDSGEPGVPGVSVTLYDNAGNVVSTTTTDANGLYQFTGLTPATYSVEFSNLPSGYEFTNSDQGGDDTRDSDADPVSGMTPTVTLIAGQNYPDFDAGIYTNLASLGNYVWNDLDQDGIQDGLEEGIPGITVTLYASDGVTAISSAVTNASGYYSFVNLIPDTYVVGFSNIPENAFFSPSNVGSDDGLDSDADAVTGRTGTVTLSAGEYNPTLDAGIYIPQGAGLGDYVWMDLNNDGQQDANEPGVPGVTAILNDGTGNPIKSTITDASGYYTFPNLAPGIYSVTFTTLPYQRLFALQNTGNDVSDNDVISIVNLQNGYPESGTTGNYTIAAGEYNPTIDAGISNAIPLGVGSILAQATLREHLSTVRWVTRDEKNVHHFEIERSTNAATFNKVATHVAVGTTQGEQGYQIVDDVLDLMGEAIIYYRVKVLDIDGRFMYSNTVSVRPGSSEQISAYPSPFSSSVMLDYLSDADSELEIVMTDLSGRKVYQSYPEVKEGMNRITLNGLGALANGIYSIRVKDFYTNAEFVLRVQKQ